MECSEPETYEGVHVLLLGWEHEDEEENGNKAMRVGLQKLENVFQGFFNYTTYSEWRIPIETPTHALNTRLLEFRTEHNRSRNLLIVYYAGHGATDEDRNLSWLWYNDLQSSPRVQWNALQTIFLTDCIADVLFVIDCCNALSAVRATSTVSASSAMLWAACSADTTTPQSGPTSFTENLISELEDVGAEGMDVEEINRRLVIRMDQIQSLSKLFTRNAPQCVRISRAQSHRSIRLRRLPHLEDEQLQHGVQLPTVGVESDSRSPERPRSPVGEPSREPNMRHHKTCHEAHAPDTGAPFIAAHSHDADGDDVTETLKRLEAACLPAQDPLTPELLRILSFAAAKHRLEVIDEAACNTFGWIFQHPAFVKWISEPNSSLWIQGKPGSGKSTLMKVVMTELSRPEILKQNQKSQLVSHFFWAAGAPIQKSFEGFARNLLYQVIENAPQAGDYILKQIGTDPQEILSSSGHKEMRLAQMLKDLFHQPESPLFETPWSILVDGLDECGTLSNGHDLSRAIILIDLLQRANGVKVIVASRPEVGIAETFSKIPSLRLQDLTANDIEAYVSSNLQDPLLLQRYLGSSRPEIEKLATQVVRRAEGVFLWVVLAVRDLREGMRNKEDVAELEKRLNEIPAEVLDVYKEIFSSLDWTTSGLLLSLVFASEVDVVEVESEAKVQPLLSTTALFFAQRLTLEQVVKAPIRADSANVIRDRTDFMAKFLRETTRDLLIPEERKGEIVAWPEDGSIISYLHKTAYDFLVDIDMRSAVRNLIEHINFNPPLALLRAMIMQLKIQDLGIGDIHNPDDVFRLRCWSKIAQAMSYAEKAMPEDPSLTSDAEKTAQQVTTLLQELDRVVTYQLTKWSSGSLNHHWSEFLPLGRQRHDDEKGTFLSFMTSCGFFNYLHLQCQCGFEANRKPGRPLLDYAIHPQPEFKERPQMISIAEHLLHLGANPNDLVDGQTVYYRLLVMLCRSRNENSQSRWSKQLFYLSQQFRLHRADLTWQQLFALEGEDGIELSKEVVEWFKRRHGIVDDDWFQYLGESDTHSYFEENRMPL